MSGFRVAHHQRSPKRQKRQASLHPKNSQFSVLRILFIILSGIGRPFYLTLETIFELLIATVWHIGNISLKAARGKRGNNFLPLALLSFPKISISFPKLSIPEIKFPHIKKRYKLTFLFLLFISASWLSFWVFLLRDLPNPGTLATRNQAISTKIYDRNGTLLYKVYRNENRSLLQLSEVPNNMQKATIAIEDEEFYFHYGFSLKGITRSLYKNFKNGQLSGGSTITQQLVKTTLLSPEKTLLRKVKEIILAIQVEMVFTKDEILTMYLNEVSYGGSSYGIEEAAQTYFGKSAKNIDLAESALLAGLTQRPTAYSPFGANPQLALNRQKEILRKMYELKFITKEEREKAENKDLVFTKPRNNIHAPHFVMYVKQLLAEKYGDNMVEQGGLEVTTSLDLSIQEMVQAKVSSEIAKIKHLNISNGAAIVTNPTTGEILAMVGSHDYFDQVNDGNVNVTTSLRQPGSSIKPITYSYGIDSGMYNASSIISDSPITYNVFGSIPYTPRNYTGGFRGNVTLRDALGSSLNIPAVKTLASFGVPKMVEHARKLGITTWEDSSRFGLSLALGAGEVKMTDMAVVYGTFANYGKRVELKPVLKVVDYKGQILQDNSCVPINTVSKPKQENPTTKITSLFDTSKAYAKEAPIQECGRQVIKEQTAFIITDILNDNKARTPTFGPRSQLVIDKHPEIAVKTGTTQNLRDNWTIGYNQQYMVLAWVGNNNNKPMSYVASGVTGASPIWHNIMTSLVENKPALAWQEPGGIVRAKVCLGSTQRQDYFVIGKEPKTQCVVKKEEPKNNDLNTSQPVGQVL